MKHCNLNQERCSSIIGLALTRARKTPLLRHNGKYPLSVQYDLYIYESSRISFPSLKAICMIAAFSDLLMQPCRTRRCKIVMLLIVIRVRMSTSEDEHLLKDKANPYPGRPIIHPPLCTPQRDEPLP